jgi:methanogenic corrinoid protein MtbC1
MTGADELSDARDAFLAAQLAGDRRGAVALVAKLATHQGAHSAAIRFAVIRAAQEEIGRLWQENQITIAQEHMATAISQLALAELFRHEQPHPRNGRRIVVACVEGELHDFPARLVADELDLAGYDVRYLGASVPTDHLLTFLATDRPDLLVLSATMAFHADAVRTAVRRLRAAEVNAGHRRLPIALGGQLCQWLPTLAGELDVDVSGGDAMALVARADGLLGVRS